MKRSLFKKINENKILLLDGAMGTSLYKKGLKTGQCPEKWAYDNIDIISKIHKGYVKAGSDIILTATLSANRDKLSEYSLDNMTSDINRKLAETAKKAAGTKAYVAGDISSLKSGIKPLGKLEFEEAVDIYKQQASALLEGGADLFAIETMTDIQEARAALIAIREICSLPVMVTMTFDNNYRTLSGTPPESAVITLQSLGADAVGANCGMGPDKMSGIIKRMAAAANVPIIAKPNAGLPKLINNKTVFDMCNEEFSYYIKKLISSGASIVGGCCGTDKEYIGLIKSSLPDVKIEVEKKNYVMVSSQTGFFKLVKGKGPFIIGERINPTGKEKMQKELAEGKTFGVLNLAKKQQSQGAHVLDVNTGVPGADQKEIMEKVVTRLSYAVKTPLCIDSSDKQTVESALRLYPGRAIVNSISNEREKIEEILPAAAKYGAVIIILPVEDNGLPGNIQKKHEIIKEIYEKAESFDYTKEDIIVDALTMSIASDPLAALNVFETLEWCRDEFKALSVIGLSNISFGMPGRKNINETFLALCVKNGLDIAIADPSIEKESYDGTIRMMLEGSIEHRDLYLSYYKNKKRENSGKDQAGNESDIYNCIIDGNEEQIVEKIKYELDKGVLPYHITDKYLIPAINEVGNLYEKGEYYLPQLISSSNTMKKGMSFLKPYLKEKTEKENKPVIVLATVKDDIHDIGKNIVGLVLENNGFIVHDLGKNIESERIIEEAVKKNADLIGLSALMTTTMRNMEDVIKLRDEKCPDIKIMIGGACVTEKYAAKINADGYAENANEAVKTALTLINKPT